MSLTRKFAPFCARLVKSIWITAHHHEAFPDILNGTRLVEMTLVKDVPLSIHASPAFSVVSGIAASPSTLQSAVLLVTV